MFKEEYGKKFWFDGLTVDTVIFTIDEGELKVLLVKRPKEPFKESWTLPGGFLLKGEELSQAAVRVLRDKTGVDNVYLEQLYTFGKKGRDPRGEIITVAYFALVPRGELDLAVNKKETVELFSVEELPKLGFDHEEIISYAKSRLQAKLEYTNVVFSLLPRQFTLSQLQRTYEAIMGRGLDKRNFLKKFMSLDLIRPTDKVLTGARQRPAKLFQFISRKPLTLKKFF